MTRRRLCAGVSLLVVALLGAGPARAVDAPGGVRLAESPSGIEPPALIEGALDGIPEDEPEMEAYSHGNYALFLVGSLWSIALLCLVVFTGFAGTLQRLAERVARGANLKVALYAVLLTLVMFLGSFPLSLYGGLLRERSYGFANQTLFEWLGDQGKGLMVSAVLWSILWTAVYFTIRRMPRRWWLAGAAIGIVFMIVALAVAPVFIAPLFNTFEPLKDEALKDDILAMARAQGIPADEVYQVDASRQSEHNNAYVAGLLGTQRIVLYDTTLRRFSPREIRFVMGHEMGHYVLHHIWRFVAFFSVVIVFAFLLVDRAARRLIAVRPGLGIASLAEPASLPVMMLMFNLLFFVMTPAVASFSRVQERQADQFALEVTGDPLAGASSFIKFARHDLGEYQVHPWIETLLYTHPSLGSRIRHAQDYARARGLEGGRAR
ncbi:MAG: M48 family metallopeptidase [Acidobacteriota bacterium]